MQCVKQLSFKYIHLAAARPRASKQKETFAAFRDTFAQKKFIKYASFVCRDTFVIVQFTFELSGILKCHFCKGFYHLSLANRDLNLKFSSNVTEAQKLLFQELFSGRDNTKLSCFNKGNSTFKWTSNVLRNL